MKRNYQTKRTTYYCICTEVNRVGGIKISENNQTKLVIKNHRKNLWVPQQRCIQPTCVCVQFLSLRKRTNVFKLQMHPSTRMVFTKRFLCLLSLCMFVCLLMEYQIVWKSPLKGLSLWVYHAIKLCIYIYIYLKVGFFFSPKLAFFSSF